VRVLVPAAVWVTEVAGGLVELVFTGVAEADDSGASPIDWAREGLKLLEDFTSIKAHFGMKVFGGIEKGYDPAEGEVQLVVQVIQFV